MRRITFFVLFTVLTTFQLAAQRAEITPNVKTVVRLGIIDGLGLGVEHQIARNITLAAFGEFGASFSSSKINGDRTFNFNVEPKVSVSPRFYVTQKKREQLGKRTDYFSGGYIGIPIELNLANYTPNASVVYGFQKTLNKRGYLDMSAGLRSNWDDGDFSVAPNLNFKLGILLNRIK